jgi:hypothetical protein
MWRLLLQIVLDKKKPKDPVALMSRERRNKEDQELRVRNTFRVPPMFRVLLLSPGFISSFWKIMKKMHEI